MPRLTAYISVTIVFTAIVQVYFGIPPFFPLSLFHLNKTKKEDFQTFQALGFVSPGRLLTDQSRKWLLVAGSSPKLCTRPDCLLRHFKTKNIRETFCCSLV